MRIQQIRKLTTTFAKAHSLPFPIPTYLLTFSRKVWCSEAGEAGSHGLR